MLDKTRVMNENKILVTHINIRQSIFFLLLKLVVLDLFLIFFVLIFFSSLSASVIPNDIKLQLLSHNLSFFLILGIVKTVITVFVILQWLNSYYEIWPSSIIYKRGIIWKKEEEFPYGHIRSIKIEQGVFGRMLTYGTLSLYDYSLKRYATLYLIHNPIKYFRILDGLLPKAEKEKQILREHVVEREEK